MLGQHFLEIKTLRIKSVISVRLFHCTYGRQAWRRYTEQSFYTDLQHAKAYCEQNRSKGKSFYIKELPALQVSVDGAVFFITQLNNIIPLASFRPESSGTQVKKQMLARQIKWKSCLAFGVPLDVLMDALKIDSGYWKEKVLSNQTIICSSDDNSKVAEKLDTQKMKEYSSLSKGAKYALIWFEKETEINGKAVLSLVSQYGFENHVADNVHFLSEPINKTKGLILRQAKKKGYQDLIAYINADEYEVTFANYENLFTIREYFVYMDKNNELFSYVTDLIVEQLNLGVLHPKIPERLHELFRGEVLPVFVKLKKMARNSFIE